MKKFIKNNLKVFITILITAIICISGTVYAAIKIQASEIGYNDTTVDQALNDLYTTSNRFNSINISFSSVSYSNTINSQANFNFDEFANYYKYFKINSLTTNTSTSYCVAQIWSSEQGKYIDAALDTEYQINSSTDGYKFTLISTLTRSSDGSLSSCKANITL